MANDECSGIGTSRSPVNQGPNGALGQEKEVSSSAIGLQAPHSPTLTTQDLNNTLMSGQRNFSDPQQQLQQRQQQANEGQEVSATGQSAEQPPLAQMSELDRFGLSGLLRMIHSESPDVASLAVGQDLMTLGLDLNQPEYAILPLASTYREVSLIIPCGLGLSTLRLPRPSYPLCPPSHWNRTSLCPHATTSPTYSLYRHGSLGSAMKPFSTSSIACLGTSCRSWLLKS